MMRHHAIEAGSFGNMPRSVRRQGPLRKSERNRLDCEPATPRTLRGPGPETDWNVDWRRGGGRKKVSLFQIVYWAFHNK